MTQEIVAQTCSIPLYESLVVIAVWAIALMFTLVVLIALGPSCLERLTAWSRQAFGSTRRPPHVVDLSSRRRLHAATFIDGRRS